MNRVGTVTTTHLPSLKPQEKGGGFLSGIRDFFGDVVIGDDFATTDSQRLRDYAMAGAGAGALIGGAVGVYKGFQGQGSNSIQEYQSTERVVHHRLDGYNYSVVPDYHTECETVGSGEDAREVCTTELDGWWHNYSPRIDYRTVDTFQQPRYRHTQFWEPLRGGLLGALGGGLIGLGVGAGTAVLQKAIIGDDFAGGRPAKRLDPDQRDAVRSFAGTSALVGGVVGATVGAYLGVQAGQAEISSQQVFTRSWDAPVLQSEYLGDIPRDWYQYNWGIGFPAHSRDFSHGRDAIYRNNPVYDGSGQVRYQQVSRTFETGRYGPVMGAISGGLIGAGLGVVAGLATGVAAKLIAENKAPTS